MSAQSLSRIEKFVSGNVLADGTAILTVRQPGGAIRQLAFPSVGNISDLLEVSAGMLRVFDNQRSEAGTPKATIFRTIGNACRKSSDPEGLFVAMNLKSGGTLHFHLTPNHAVGLFESLGAALGKISTPDRVIKN